MGRQCVRCALCFANDIVALMDNDAIVHAECAGEDRVFIAANIRILLRVKPLFVGHQVTRLVLVDDEDVGIAAINLYWANHRILVGHSDTLSLADDIRSKFVVSRDSVLCRLAARKAYAVFRRGRRECLKNLTVNGIGQPVRQARLRILAHINLRLLLIHLAFETDSVTQLVNRYLEVTVNQRFLVALQRIIAGDASALEFHEQRNIDGIAVALLKLRANLDNRVSTRTGEFVEEGLLYASLPSILCPCLLYKSRCNRDSSICHFFSSFRAARPAQDHFVFAERIMLRYCSGISPHGVVRIISASVSPVTAPL